MKDGCKTREYSIGKRVIACSYTGSLYMLPSGLKCERNTKTKTDFDRVLGRNYSALILTATIHIEFAQKGIFARKKFAE